MSYEDATTQGDDNDDARFQLAAQAARGIIRRCRAHARITAKNLQHYADTAGPATLYATDLASAESGSHRIAFDQTVHQVESLSNAIVGHVSGLHVLMQSDTFHPLPATVIARSITEVAASCSWMLRQGVSADERAARAYAVLFHSLENGVSQLLQEDADHARQIREGVVRELSRSGITVTRREKRGMRTDEVAQVSVGRAHVKTAYQISQRIAEEIPAIGSTYSGLSSTAHGEQMHVVNAAERPETYARLIGFVVHESVAAWSSAVHGWLGVEPSPIGNDDDLKKLQRSIHPEVVASIMGRHQKNP